MIVIGGEPPFIEEPEPRFGQVLVGFNQLKYTVEERTVSFNDNIKTKLKKLDTDITSFINEVIIPTQQHLAAIGAVHGENRSSVGLGKKDNYRAATIQEQESLAPVDAFVTPAGAKAALEKNNTAFILENYQQNDQFQFSAYYFPDQYPSKVPTRVDPVRYFGSNRKVGVMFNADRLIFSPYSDLSVYSDQTAFISMPVGPSKRSQLGEIANLSLSYITTGWNTMGGLMSDGTVAFFRPVVDKKVYQFRNGLALGNGKNFILYRGYNGQLFKGAGVGFTADAQVIELNHRFFEVNQFDTNPIMEDIVGSSYLALFDLMGKAQFTAPANGSHQISILDYITLPAGMTAAIGGNNSHGILLTLLWNAQDYELYLNVCIPVTLTKGSEVAYITVNVTEAIIPGALAAGGSATFRTVGTRTKDVIGTDFSLPTSPNFVRKNDLFDFNNPVQVPGAVVAGGEVVKSMAGKYGVRVKRYMTQYQDLKSWLTDLERVAVEPKLASTELFVPARHTCFTALPERLFPVNHEEGSITTYLAYGLDASDGKFKWFELSWTGETLVSTDSGTRFGVRLPDTAVENKNIGQMPQGLSITANKESAGTGLSALVFTTQNGFKGKQSIQYLDKKLTLGADIALSFSSLTTLQAAGAGLLGRARSLNPAVQDASRAAQIQVYALTGNKAVVVITDGVNYAEAAVAGYSVSGSEFVLDFTATGGLKLNRVTATAQSVKGVYRKSMSGDDVWMPFSDMHAMMTSSGTYQIALVRPFGELYGDISFGVANITSANPAFTVGRLNGARLYSRAFQFDTVDEVYPPVMIPNKGIYQTDPSNNNFQSNMLEVMGTVGLDPFEINETGWVRMPSGGRAVIDGRTYVLDKDYAIKVNPTGTTYCYLVRQGDLLVAIGASTPREPSNKEVLFGTATNGVLTLNRQYIVMDNKVLSADSRFGSAIPAFINDGGNGPNNFFTRRDIVG